MINVLKYIEILSIEQVEDKYYLQISLHSNEAIEVYWQIDEVTYENLYLQCDFSGSDRYRLSFKIIENPMINKLVGRITRTYLTSSSMIDFQTTKEFKEQLKLIKLHCQTNTLYQLAFIQPKIPGFYTPEEVESLIQDATTEENVPPILETTVDKPISDIVDKTEAVTSEEQVEQLEAEIIEDLASIEENPIDAQPSDDETISVDDTDTEQTVKESSEVIEQPLSVNNATTEEVVEEKTEIEFDEHSPSISETTDTLTNIEVETANPVVATEEEQIIELEAETETQAIDSTQEQSKNQATALVKLIDDREQKLQEDSTVHVADVAQEKEEVTTKHVPTTMHFNPIQTLLTLPKIQQDLQHAPTGQSSEGGDLTEVIPASENHEIIENEIIKETNEKSNFSVEEQKVTETQLPANDTVTAAEPVEPTSQLHNLNNTTPIAKAETDSVEAQPISNNMIALIAVGVAILLAVAVYFIFFQQNTTAPNIEASEVSNTSNAVTYHIDESFTFSLPNQYVAITFNRGPSPYTEEIMNILQQYNYGATFFLQGNQVPLYPEIVEKLDVSGHSIGHITSSHTLLTILEIEDQREALIEPKEEIEKLINKETLLVRPPFNIFDEKTISIQQEYDLKMVNSTMPLKSNNTIPADAILQEFDNKNLNGAIIALDESQSTVEALPVMLDKIKDSGLQVVILQ